MADEPDAQLTAFTVTKSQLSQAAFSTSDQLQAGVTFLSNGNLVFSGEGDIYRTTSESVLIDKWLLDVDQATGIGSNYEIQVTQQTGTITGTTSGYVSLGTSREVTGQTLNANTNQSTSDQARIQIRKVGSGTDDVDVILTFEADTNR